MISALITLYEPSESVTKNILSISSQVDRVFLLDNSKKSNYYRFSNIANCIYCFNNGNYALSKAFNRVLRDKDLGWDDEDYIIFFDQDSSAKQGHIKRLIDEYKKIEKIGVNIAGIGPIYYNLNTKQLAIPRIKKRIDNDNYIVKCIITSSLLCKYKSLRMVDFWNENVFLDLADWDLCWRMLEKGMMCVKTKAVVFDHALGSGIKKIGFLKLGISSPIREYYQTRNYLYLLTKKYTPFKFRIMFLRNLTIRPILHLLFLSPRIQRIKFVFEGYRDFFRGKNGEWQQ